MLFENKWNKDLSVRPVSVPIKYFQRFVFWYKFEYLKRTREVTKKSYTVLVSRYVQINHISCVDFK